MASSYVTGEKAKKAVEAWKEASGTSELMHYMASDPSMTLGKLCELYSISQDKKDKLYETLSSIAGSTYNDDTKFRLSVLDNSFYNYSAGAYTGERDFAEVPYLTFGSAFGGLVSSVFEFESSGVNLNLYSCTFENKNGADFAYLAASEAGSAPVLNFYESDASGIIFNEGDVFRFVEGRPGMRSSSITANFFGSTFEGSFAAGSNGLHDVDGLSYEDAQGNTVSRNGNFYDAKANWGISASFDKDSAWIVTEDSYLGNLVIEDGAEIKAADGKTLVMTVDGIETPIEEGTYSGHIIISVK